MGRDCIRNHLARFATGEYKTMNQAFVRRLEATVEHLDSDDEELADLVARTADRMMELTVET